MRFEEFLIKLRNGETFENIAKDTMVECMGNLAFEDCDLYEFLGNMGADIKSFDMGYALICADGKNYKLPYELIKNRFDEDLVHETVLDFNEIYEI